MQEQTEAKMNIQGFSERASGLRCIGYRNRKAIKQIHEKEARRRTRFIAGVKQPLPPSKRSVSLFHFSIFGADVFARNKRVISPGALTPMAHVHACKEEQCFSVLHKVLNVRVLRFVFLYEVL